MDVDIAEIPASYADYRERLRAALSAGLPDITWRARAGFRVPDDAHDVAQLRRWVAALHDAGFVIDRYGVTGGDPIEARILTEELTATGLPFVLGNQLVLGGLIQYGTPSQQERFVGPTLRGDVLWTQLFSEPDAGSDLAALRTRAELDGDAYVITGQKVWSTWAQFADFGYLLARSEPTAGPGGISAFALDMRSPGVEVRPLREITGTADFNEVFLDHVRVPVDHLIGRPGQGWEVATASLLRERNAVGGRDSRAEFERLVRLARRCRRRGHRTIDDPSVRQDLGRLAAATVIQRALGHTMATRREHGTASAADAPVAKLWFSELNMSIARTALAVQGPSAGLTGEGAPDDGYWQDAYLYARAWTIAGGTNEIMRNLIAERCLGLPREGRP